MSGDTVHATTVALDDAGVLIRGAAGAGKTTLAHALLAAWRGAGRFARLVADDRTALAVSGGRLVARPPAAIAGLAELRGVGIVAAEHLAAVRLTLVVDLVPRAEVERMPETGRTALCGVDLPALSLEACNTFPATLTIAAVLCPRGLTARRSRDQRPPHMPEDPERPGQPAAASRPGQPHRRADR